MPQKSKPATTEPLSGDILDLLWTHVINPDPGGAWLDTALKNSTNTPEPLKTALPAIKRLLALKNSREDLARVARLERYERCFGLLYELDDPGLKSGKLTGLREQLLKSPARAGKEEAFMEVLWEGIGDAADEGERWAEVSPKARIGNEPFGDVNAAVARLRKAGAQPCDLELFARWQRFEATVGALQVFQRAGIKDAEELIGLHESILGAEPSGKEGRPGSWPPPIEAPTQTVVSANPTQAFLVLKSIEAFGFSPDGKMLLVAPNAGAFRLVDPETGKVLTTLAFKGRASGWEFSSNSKRVLMAIEPNQIQMCDAVTGAVLEQVKWPGKSRGISVLRAPTTDQLLVTTVAPNGKGGSISSYHMADGNNLASNRQLEIPGAKSNTSLLEFAPDGRTLFVFHGGLGEYELLAFAWPTIHCLWAGEPAPDFGPGSLVVSTDGKLVAAASFAGTLMLYDVATGKQCDTVDMPAESARIAFHPSNRFLAIGEHGTGKIRIWDLMGRRVARELDTGTGWCFGVCFSPDGKILAAASHRQSMFWRFEPLIARR